MTESCFRCGKALSNDDIGAYKKFISRGSTEFMCIGCLADDLKITEELVHKKIEQFKKQGCTLFVSSGKQTVDEIPGPA